MFEKVLILTDFSAHAKSVLDCITGISGIREIILLHVSETIKTPMGAETVEAFVTGAAENALEAEKRYLETLAPDIRVTAELTASSDIAGTVLGTAEKNGIDLVILSAHGLGMKTGILTGTVSTAVLCRISRINVLVMRHKIIESLSGTTYEKFCPMIFSRILCPTDFSRYSDQAITLAGSLKAAGEIILVHIVSSDGPVHEIKKEVGAAEIRLNAIRDTLAGRGIRARALVRTGNPAGGIAETAEEEDVSVIWISSSGKGCLHGFVFGSTVSDVVMNAKRPVIVIRALE